MRSTRPSTRSPDFASLSLSFKRTACSRGTRRVANAHFARAKLVKQIGVTAVMSYLLESSGAGYGTDES